MREFKVGDEVQAKMNAIPVEIRGLVGQVRKLPSSGSSCLHICFPEYKDDDDGILYGPGVWPMLPTELILLTPVEDAQS